MPDAITKRSTKHVFIDKIIHFCGRYTGNAAPITLQIVLGMCVPHSPVWLYFAMDC